LKANAGQLPPDNTRPPKIMKVAPKVLKSSVVTTDFFGFDTSDDHFKLQGLGDVSEMGDAVLGLVSKQMGLRRHAGWQSGMFRIPKSSRWHDY
jgi:hypothetical protein